MLFFVDEIIGDMDFSCLGETMLLMLIQSIVLTAWEL